MKKPKHAILFAKKTQRTDYEYQVQCPHCKAYLTTGGAGILNESILMFLCWRCNEPIDLREKNKVAASTIGGEIKGAKNAKKTS